MYLVVTSGYSSVKLGVCCLPDVMVNRFEDIAMQPRKLLCRTLAMETMGIARISGPV